MVDDAVPLRQAQQRGELFLRCIGVERELQPYVLEADWSVLGHAQRSAEVEITFGLQLGVSQFNAERRCYRVQRYASAGNQGFEQHVA